LKHEGQNKAVQGTKADPTGKGHKAQKKTLCPHKPTHIVRGKAQKEIAQAKAMFIHCLLLSHIQKFAFCFCIGLLHQLQIFHIFLQKCLFLFCPQNYPTSSRLFSIFILSSSMHYTPHNSMASENSMAHSIS